MHVRTPASAATYAVPLAALLQKDGAAFVWVLDRKTGRVHLRRVGVAAIERDAVRIATGLRSGETVVTAGVHLLHEGQPVRPLAPAATAEG